MEKWEKAVSEASLVEEASPQQESEQENYVLNLLQDVTQVCQPSRPPLSIKS